MFALEELLSDSSQWNYGPLNILSIIHVIAVCWEIRRSVAVNELSFYHTMSLIIIRSFGGTTLAAMLLGIPAPWIISSTAIPTVLIVWAVMYYSPYDFVYKILCYLDKILFPIVKMLDSISSCFSIVLFGIESAQSRSLGFFSSLTLGTLSGCGGGLVASMLGLHKKKLILAAPNHFYSLKNSLTYSIVISVMFLLLDSLIDRNQNIKLASVLSIALNMIVNNIASTVSTKKLKKK